MRCSCLGSTLANSERRIGQVVECENSPNDRRVRNDHSLRGLRLGLKAEAVHGQR